MAKLVLEVRCTDTPNHSDLIVYDKINACWVVVSRQKFLAKTEKEIGNLKLTVNSLKEEVKQAKEDIQTMAKIMKEGIK